MTGSPTAQDVVDALDMMSEREDASGAPWCPPADAIAVRRWVTDRGASLGSGIRRLVRLARLMAIADGRDYVRFLYSRVKALRGRQFQHALQKAGAEGRLPENSAFISDTAARLRELASDTRGGTIEEFEISFSQMPRLAALLDFLHNALGFTVVADILGPALRQDTSLSTANEVSRVLHAVLNAWLSVRLESANHILQAQRIRAFLATRGPVTPDSVDNEAIFQFWTTLEANPEGEGVEGFRLFRSLVRAMLRYRQALRDAAAAKHLHDSIKRGMKAADSEAEHDWSEASIDAWRSPLAALLAQPARRVKWLTKLEQQRLLNYLGGAVEEDTAEPSESDIDLDPWKSGLAGDERFDLAFSLTLLRADVFGAVQASLVGRLRKRADARAVLQSMDLIDDTAYTVAATAYVDLQNQLKLECLAALVAMMEGGAAEAFMLLEHLAGQPAVRSLIGQHAFAANDGSAVDVLRDSVAPALKAALADPASLPHGSLRALMLEAVAAARKVGRTGFRREDRADPDMLVALRAGAPAIVGVLQELERLNLTLSQKARSADIASDRARFLATLGRMYVEGRPA